MKRALAEGKKFARNIRDRIRLRRLPDGDYKLGYSFLHRSLQPQLSADYAACASELGEEVAKKWSRDGCGIASAAIAVEAAIRVNQHDARLDPVTYLCERYRDSAYRTGIGWMHGGIVQFAKDHGANAYNEPSESLSSLCASVLDGWIPIASVTLYFKGGEQFEAGDGSFKTRAKGGHLIVITGFRLAAGVPVAVFVQDCQNQVLKDGETADELIPVAAFTRSFSGKVIYIKPMNGAGRINRSTPFVAA